MKERPILFSGPMVRAILDGRKTVTRRPATVYQLTRLDGPDAGTKMDAFATCSYGAVGDLLWVREAFRLRADQDHKPPSQDWWKNGAWYEADDGGHSPTGCAGGPGKLRPSIHMPRWASRITLRVTSVRVERLLDITEEGIAAEGFDSVASFQQAMKRAYGDGITYLNTWCWVIGFERVAQRKETPP